MVFVSDAVLLDVSFSSSHSGLEKLIADGSLLTASHSAFDVGVLERAQADPGALAPPKSRLIRVKFAEPVPHGDSVLLILRWEAAGNGLGLFPALDADITLSPVAGQTTLLRLEGIYRAPAGARGAAPDPALLRRMATATIRAFVGHVGDAITDSVPVLEAEPGGGAPAPPAWPPQAEES